MLSVSLNVQLQLVNVCKILSPDIWPSTVNVKFTIYFHFYFLFFLAINSCDAQAIDAGCQGELRSHKAATCACIDEARLDLKTRIAGIADAIHDAVDGANRGAPSIGGGSKVDSCVNNIKRQLITPTNDWGAVIDNALNSCIKNKPSAQSLGIDSLLNVGCRKV